MSPATDKQMGFLAKLAQERGQPLPAGQISKQTASTLIDSLLRLPRVTVRTNDRPDDTAPAAPIEPGMYRVGDEIYKVQKSRDSDRLYAKQLTRINGVRLQEETGDRVKWEFIYAPGAIRNLTAAQRMTLDEAKAFGIQYGVCCVCGAFLKDATSVAAGIGPVCAGRV